MTIRERHPEPTNPLGIDGIEFIEFATSQPQALGNILQMMGFSPVARHRSRADRAKVGSAARISGPSRAAPAAITGTKTSGSPEARRASSSSRSSAASPATVGGARSHATST